MSKGSEGTKSTISEPWILFAKPGRVIPAHLIQSPTIRGDVDVKNHSFVALLSLPPLIKYLSRVMICGSGVVAVIGSAAKLKVNLRL